MAGVVAYVLGYLLTYVLVEMESDGALGSESVDATTQVGWIFYNTHFVDTVASGTGESQSSNFLSEAPDLTVPEPVWYLIPILFLLLAGFIAAKGIESRHASGQNGAAAGAALVAGYLPLAVIGTFFFKYEQSAFGQTFSAAPDQTMGIVLAGIVYPLAIGAIGGALATATGSSSGGASPGGAGSRGGRQTRSGQAQGRRQQRSQQQRQRQGSQQQRGRQQQQQGRRQQGQQNRQQGQQQRGRQGQQGQQQQGRNQRDE